MPEEDFYVSKSAGIRLSYAYDKVDSDLNSDIGDADDLLICLEREEGAKNPSLGGSPDEVRRMIRPPQPIHRTQKHQYPPPNDRHQEHANPNLKRPQPIVFPFSNKDISYKRSLLVSSTEASTRTDSGSD